MPLKKGAELRKSFEESKLVLDKDPRVWYHLKVRESGRLDESSWLSAKKFAKNKKGA